ncbi:hypothetical protein [Agrococcus sp. TSP3-2-1]|uniref:hypothetical protein n=1 Tax=Agrococcus sp. TSP3-2-1 TaxID=2804583 RepID=UPI003CF87030
MADGATMPVLELKAQLRGMPTRVWVFRDRIEWSRSTALGVLSRSVMAAATQDASEVGAAGGDDQTGTIPLGQLYEVTGERIGLHTRLTLRARDCTIDLDMSGSKAARLQESLRTLKTQRADH